MLKLMWTVMLTVALLPACTEDVPTPEHFLDQQDVVADVPLDATAEDVDAQPGEDADAVDARDAGDSAADEIDAAVDETDAAADEVDAAADEIDAAVDETDATADGTDAAADETDAAADGTDAASDETDAAADGTDATADGTDAAADGTDAAADEIDVAADAIDPDSAADQVDSAGDAVDSGPVCVAAQCDDGNPCTTDDCGSDGNCVHEANSVTCTDGDACTENDGCSGKVCVGTAKVCDDGNACTTDGCDKGSGCTSLPLSDTPCEDGSACTSGDSCQGGKCTSGIAKVCVASDQCHDVGSCDATSGACSNPAKSDGSSCSDNDACTLGDACSAGSCASGTPMVCNALNGCHNVGTCDGGVCSNPLKTDGDACTDGNPCTSGDGCKSGECKGTAVVCTASNECHNVGVCDLATGACSNPAKGDGTTCSDGNPCTVSDNCVSGTCTSGGQKPCTASDNCHNNGTCDPTTGNCSNPAKDDGTACDDGSACTWDDACKNGVCTPGKSILWDATVGTAGEEQATSLVQLGDGSFVMGGYTNAKGAGAYDFWLRWYFPDGSEQWEATEGGTDDDWMYAIAKGNDNNLLLAGYTYSYGTGGDMLVYITDNGGSVANSGNYGGPQSDCANAILGNGDKTYYVAGYTESFGAGGKDGWLVHLAPNAVKLWDKTYGGSGDDRFWGMADTGDGYVLVGESNSGGAGGKDMWVVRVNLSGNIVWERRFGGTGTDSASSVVFTSDGSLAIAGSTDSKGSGGSDFWLVRTDGNGNRLWDRTYGGGGTELASSVVALGGSFALGGFALGGWTDSFGSGDRDVWLVRTDLSGSQIATKAIGGSQRDYAAAMTLGTNTSVALAGSTKSKGKGDYDYWLVQSDIWGNTTCATSGNCEGFDPTLAACDDGNACTADLCTASTGCTHVNLASGSWCNDNDSCTINESCKGAVCTGGVPSTWSNALGVDYYAGMNAVTVSSSGYAFAGTSRGVDKLWMVVTDFAGNLVYPGASADDVGLEVNYGGDDRLFGATTLSDGYAFVGQTSEIVTNNNLDGVVYVLGLDGSTKKGSASYGGTGNDYLYSVASRSSGLVMCGKSNSPGSSDYDFWLVTSDFVGASSASMFFDLGSSDSCRSILVDPSGDLVLAGTTTNKAALLRTNGSGSKIWSKSYSGTTNGSFSTVVPNGSGFILGGTRDTSTAGNQLWLVSVDGSGTVLWEKNYGGTTSDDRGAGLAAVSDGFILVGQTNGFGATGTDAFAVRTDLFGNQIWQKRLDKPANSKKSGNDEIANAVAATTNGFVLALTDSVDGWGDGWIARIDSWGKQTCSEEGGVCGTYTTTACDDGNPCTTDVCDPSSVDPCVHTTLANGSVCGSGALTCQSGKCQ